MRTLSLRAALVLFAALALAPAGRAADSTTVIRSFAAEPVTGETPVKLERTKRHRDKPPTLRFLRANRDFIRLSLDRTRQLALARDESPLAVDPRFLDYPRMLASVLGARDSVALADDALRRRELFESVTQLGQLEAQLDLLDRLLADQRSRLGVLQANFTGQQRTALLVVASGYPTGATISRVSVQLEDGDTLSVELSDEQRAALERGAAVQIFHGFAEPREQDVRVGIDGAAWPGGDAAWVHLDPTRDRLTVLRLDLSGVQGGTGVGGIRASTWLHEARPAGSGI